MAQPPPSSSQNTFLDPFRSRTFDPITYLNDTLPPLQPQSQTQTQSSRSASAPAVPLSTLLEHSSSLLARLAAQTSLTSDTLTSLTDEILRGGARLAFEVEVLRSEVVGLEDVWTTHAHSTSHASPLPTTTTSSSDDPSSRALTALKTQSRVRHHLESVRQTFDLALSFPLPPQSVLQAQGELGSWSYSSGPKLPPPYLPASLLEPLQTFLSLPLPSNVSVRTPTTANTNAGSNVVVGPKLEVVPAVGVSLERALNALDAADEVCAVWRGTSEEKIRRAVVELWRGAVEERRDVEVRSGRVSASVEGEGEVVQSETMPSPEAKGSANGSGKGLASAGTVGASAAKGLLSGLRRLRDEIYLE